MDLFARLEVAKLAGEFGDAGHAVMQSSPQMDAIPEETTGLNNCRSGLRDTDRTLARDMNGLRPYADALHPIHVTQKFGHELRSRTVIDLLG